MTGLQLALLALVQGITEFLPISSSAHLILVPVFTGWPDQGPMIDVAVHVGTLGAVIVYFRRDVWQMISGLGRLGRNDRDRDPGLRLAFHVVVATIPVVVAGAVLTSFGLSILRSPVLIGWTTAGFGVLLYIADRSNMTIRKIEHMTLAHALFIGVVQAVALIPGTSRAGITMTAARVLGYERTESARFSMLLSIPTIIAAGALAGVDQHAVDVGPLGRAGHPGHGHPVLPGRHGGHQRRPAGAHVGCFAPQAAAVVEVGDGDVGPGALAVDPGGSGGVALARHGEQPRRAQGGGQGVGGGRQLALRRRGLGAAAGGHGEQQQREEERGPGEGVRA